MAFPRVLLLSALLGSAALIKAAPVERGLPSCQQNLKQWGPMLFRGSTISIDADGDLAVGGNPIYFASSTCATQGSDQEMKGYIVNANDPTSCVTVSSLTGHGDNGATLSLQDCKFTGPGRVLDTQAFAWDPQPDDPYDPSNGYFVGAENNFVNSSSLPKYSFRTREMGEGFDKQPAKLLVDYVPNLTSLPEPIGVPFRNQFSTAPEPAATLKCKSYQTGQLIFNNSTSGANPYDGPLNSNWEAQKDTTDKFVFEHCDWSTLGLKDSDEVVYGRLRPGSDLQDNKFRCYNLLGPSETNDHKNEPESNTISGLRQLTCPYSQAAYVDNIVKLNKSDNTIVWVPFGNQSEPGVLAAYNILDYEREYDVVSYAVYDKHAIGYAYLDASNANLTKYPPGKVTFNADS